MIVLQVRSSLVIFFYFFLPVFVRNDNNFKTLEELIDDFETLPSDSDSDSKLPTTELSCPESSRDPFYPSKFNGDLCCKGTVINYQFIEPPLSGDCEISTKISPENGLLDSNGLWCSYTCSLKKYGLLNRSGNIRPYDYLTFLSQNLPSEEIKLQVRVIMEKHLKCFPPIPITQKPRDTPCTAPLGFLKCFNDALEIICTDKFPQNNNFSLLPPPKENYRNLEKKCLYDDKTVFPGCCHGQPLPWTISELIRIDRNPQIYDFCMNNFFDNSPLCETTCLLYSKGIIVNNTMDINVTRFDSEVFKYFPRVKSSPWIEYLGPIFLFYLETELNHESINDFSLKEKACLFHEKILSLAEEKVSQYCGLEDKSVII